MNFRGAGVSRLRSEIILSGTLEPDTGNAVVGNQVAVRQHGYFFFGWWIMKEIKFSQKLTESALLITFSTILSVLKIAELPYGGSITFASMLPLTIVAYRYGFPWGLLTGFVYSLIQLLLGLNTLSYATSFVAAIAIIVLDYLFAFMTTSLGAMFRKVKTESTAVALAAFTVCLSRYIFHVISGCTVWAGLSIPTNDALIYSLVYNATYMVPETIVTVVAAIYIGSMFDFRKTTIKPALNEKIPVSARVMSFLTGFVILAAVATIVVLVFPHFQNAETGAFDISGIRFVNFPLIIVIAISAVVLSAVFLFIRMYIVRKAK